MKKLLTILFVFASLASFGQNTNAFTGIIIKNSHAADSSGINKIWYNAATAKFRFWDGTGKHTFGVGAGGGLSTTLSAGHLFVGNVSNVATDVALSGDGGLSSAGALTITKLNGKTVTLGGNLTYSGAFNTTHTVTGSNTITWPNASLTVARIDAAQTFTGVQTFFSLPTIPATPSASTDAASKGYVDGLTVGPFSTIAPGYANLSGAVGSIPYGDNTWLAVGTSRKILVSNGTRPVYSTETWAVPGTSGNVLTSDGTNWTSATPAGGGGTSFTITAVKTTTYTAAVSEFVPCNTTSGGFTVTLPTAPSNGAMIGVKIVSISGTNAVIVATGGSDVFNVAAGGAALTLNLLDQTIFLQYKSSSAIWYVLNTDPGFSSLYATLIGTETLTNKTLTAPKIANAGFIADANGNALFTFTTTASAVNGVTFANAATGANPKWTASGTDANIGIDWLAKGTGTFRLTGNATQAAELRLYEITGSGTNFTSFHSPPLAADVAYTLPPDDGNSGDFFRSDGTGTLSWGPLVAGDVPSVNRIGAIYSETYNGTLGSYTNVGSGTATIVGGVLQLSGGAGTLMANYLRRDYYTSLEWNYRKVRFTSTGNSTAEGIGIGFVSRNTFSTTTYGSSMLVTMDLSAGASRGTVYIKSTSNGGSSFTTVATSANKLSYTNGDVIEVFYNVFNSTLQAIVKNITTGTEVGVIFNGSVVFGGTIFCNAVSSPVITIIGGTQSVSLDEFGSDYRRQPLIAFVGDSETFGFYSSSLGNHWASQLTARINGVTAKMASTGSGLTDILNAFNDVILAAPKYLAINEGINEAVNSTALGTVSTVGTYAYKMQQIVNSCEANGMIPIFLYSAPVASALANSATIQALIESYNTFLTTQYGDRYIVIDIATNLKSGGFLAAAYNSGDNVHFNSVAQSVVALDVLAGINKILSTNLVTAAGLQGQIQFNNLGSLGAINKLTWDGTYFKVGATNEFTVLGDYAGSSEIPASTALYGSGHGNVAMFPDILTATAGSKLILAYNSGGGVRSALEVAHTASTFGALAIMKSGGTTTFGGATVHTQQVLTSGWTPILTLNPGAHTGMTAATEFPNVVIGTVSQKWVDGTVATQRWNWIKAPTVLGTTTLATVTDGYNLYVDAPLAGSLGAVTNPWAVGVNGNLKVVGSISRFGGATGVFFNGNTIGFGGADLTGAGNIAVYDGTLTVTNISGFSFASVAGDPRVNNANGVNYSIGGSIKDYIADVNNGTTVETDLYTFTTVASTLSTDGDKLYVKYSGTFNDVTATSQLKVYFGGTAIGDTGALTVSATGGWEANACIIRTGSTTVRATVSINTPGASTALYTKEIDVTGLTLSSTNVVKITGQAGGASGGSSDITAKFGSIVFIPAAP